MNKNGEEKEKKESLPALLWQQVVLSPSPPGWALTGYQSSHPQPTPPPVGVQSAGHPHWW